MSTLKMCCFCQSFVDLQKPSLKMNYLCDDCFNDNSLVCSLTFAQKTGVETNDLKYYLSSNSKTKKYDRQEVDYILINKESSFEEATQSDLYGFISDYRRKKVIDKICESY